MQSFIWSIQMAWRESRSHRRRLLIFMGSIAVGVAAIVGVDSFRSDIYRSIDNQAKPLLGADLVVWSRQPFPTRIESQLLALPWDKSREIRFASMVHFTKSDESRLVQIRALEGPFPFYGDVDVEPASSFQELSQKQNIVLDESLFYQFALDFDDAVQVGEKTYAVSGKLKKMPGEMAFRAFVSPRVYIPYRSVLGSKLIDKGSRITYKYYFKINSAEEIRAFLTENKAKLDSMGIYIDTVENRKEFLGETTNNVTLFLSLIGLLILVIGGIGVASAIHLYMKEKVMTVAILKCLGSTQSNIFRIYGVQVALMGLVAAGGGIAAALLFQQLLPSLFSGVFPFEVESHVSWQALSLGLILALGVSLLFASWPLLKTRLIPPGVVLRSVETVSKRYWDGPQIMVVFLILFFVFLVAYNQVQRVMHAFYFVLGLGGTILILSLGTKLLLMVARSRLSSILPYVYRQGLANLYRPSNQSLIVILSLGLGLFLILLIAFSQSTLLAQISQSDQNQKPNLAFFDIQSNQLDGVLTLIQQEKLPTYETVPIVSMRIQKVKGVDVATLKADPNNTMPPWVLNWEYRCTYRNHMTDTETLVKGTWHGDQSFSDGVIPVSLESSVAKDLKVGLGDELTFNLQGVLIRARIQSLRKVNWYRMQPNFYVVFPEGVLEKAPKFFVVPTRYKDKKQLAHIQRLFAKSFPTVSSIDLSLVLETTNLFLSKVTVAIRFLAYFSVFSGFVVLIGSLLTSRLERMREMALWRTLGATQRQIFWITVTEFSFLATFAFGGALVLSMGLGWVVAQFVFEATFAPSMGPVLLSFVFLIVLASGLGLLNRRALMKPAPLAVLKAED